MPHEQTQEILDNLVNTIQRYTENLIYYNQFGLIAKIQGGSNIKKSINVIHTLNRIKEENYVIIFSIDTE